MPSVCWHCQRPWHSGDCEAEGAPSSEPQPTQCPGCTHPAHAGKVCGVLVRLSAFLEGRCKCDVWKCAEAVAAQSLQRQAEKLAAQLAGFAGYTLSGFHAGQWEARAPNGKVLRAEEPAELLRKVRKAAGAHDSAPVQEGFGW